MTVIRTTKDPEHLTLTLVADFAATPEQLWAVWEDPRKLERWWGPPTWPATFTRHDFVVGGESRFHLTGPDGEEHHGYWKMEAIDRPRRIDFANGFVGSDGEPTVELPAAAGYVTFEAIDGMTRMTAVTRFVDHAQMETLIGMGMAEGMTQAIGQIDSLLLAFAI
jgi:uncharacterized protein YndB with AHSA1/START domain